MFRLKNKLYQCWHNFRAHVNDKPIFIFGNQKTGSTAIACLLAKATDVELSQDFLYLLNPSGQELLFKKDIPFEQLIRQNKYHFSKTIIKELDLIFCMDQVLSYFPSGQYVGIIRDPRDNIRSVLNRLNLSGDKNKLSDEDWGALPNLVWRDILEGISYGTRGDFYIETLAKRWCSIIDQYDKYHFNIHVLRYEDFNHNKLEFIFQLAEYLGLTIVSDIQELVDIQYQPKGDHSISWLDFFGETNLRIIEKNCRSGMLKYGYKPMY